MWMTENKLQDESGISFLDSQPPTPGISSSLYHVVSRFAVHNKARFTSPMVRK